MTNTAAGSLAGRIQRTHKGVLSVTEDLGDEQIAQQPSPTAPPIGWHLFHIARWTDRLQASFPIRSAEHSQQPALRNEIWAVENLATQWGLKPERLGLLETGQIMNVEYTVSLALLGKSALLDYARRTFTETDQAVGELTDAQLLQPRQSILPQLQVPPTGQPRYSGERQVTVLDDLLFHITHTSCHFGMIEALRGALFATA